MKPYLNIHTHVPAISVAECAVTNRIWGQSAPVADAVDSPPLYFSVGIHPWYVPADIPSAMAAMAKEAAVPCCLFLGEMGLDKTTAVPYALQREVFVQQLRLAHRLDKPVLLHCVRAWDEVMSCCRSEAPHVPWIVHGFRGKPELARQLLRAGCYLSFGAHYHPESLALCPSDRLFLETDDSSDSIARCYHDVAAAKGMLPETLVERCWENLARVVPGKQAGWPPAPVAQKESV